MMNRERHEQVKEIFLHACELEESQRLSFLDSACEDDEIRQEVLSLLRHHSPETIISGLSETNLPHSRQPTSIDSDSWVGRQIGKYVVSRYLESGGMGVVLEAYDESIDRHVAIKVLHTELAKEESMRQRFLAEAQAAGRLNHPNVITIFEVGNEDEVFYFVMEFANGGSAADRLAREGALSVTDATAMIGEACQGLAAAHVFGLVHRDIKPANLLLASDGTVKVSDFGIAKLTDSEALQLTQEGQLVGTPSFMSPEQCEGKTVDHRSDIYSLGATYFSLLVGRPPFHELGGLVSVINAHCNAPAPDAKQFDAQIPSGCAEIIKRAMAKSPDDRFQSATAMLTALENYEHYSNVESPAQRSMGYMLASPRRFWGCVAVLLLLIAVFSGMYFRGASSHRSQVTADEGADGKVPAFVDGESIRVGVLHSLSGTMALTESAMVDACTLAIEELNSRGGVLGRRIELVLADGRSNDVVFAEQAKKLIEENRVCTVFGCCTSASRKSVMQVVERAEHLLIYAANSEGLELSPNIIYLGGDPTQTIIPCVRWAYGMAQKRSFFLVGSDYVYPRVANEIIRDQLDSLGATLVGEEYISLGSTDVSDLVDKIAAVQPDAIINTISGDSQTAFSRVLRSRGLTTTQFATGVGEQELRNADISKFIDDYSIGTYFQSIDSQVNADFVKRFQEKFGRQRVVNAAAESSYAGVLLWAQAVEAAGEVSPLAIRDAMLNQTIEAPSGLIKIDPKTHYAYRQSFIGNVEPSGQFRIVWHSPTPEAPSPYPETRTPKQWQTVLEDLYNGWGRKWSATR